MCVTPCSDPRRHHRGSCDACKTWVELATAHFRELSKKARPQGDSTPTKANRINVGDDVQSKLVGTLCNGPAYADMSEKIKGFCAEQLGGPNRRPLLRTFEGAPLEADSVPERKLHVCHKLLKECPRRKVNPVPMSKCQVAAALLRSERCGALIHVCICDWQACMEAFETLDFTMRRDHRNIKLGGSQDPLALAKKKKPKDDGFGSSLHVEMRLEELCGELHLHYKGEALEEIQEVCEEVISESSGDVKRAFTVLGKGSDYGIPSHSVCVNVAELCTEKEFDANFPYTLNFHANVTNVKAKQQTSESRRHDVEL